MSRRGPRILLLGGTYRALCLLEHLLERGERVAAFIGQEGGSERDLCPEILEICDRMSIPSRSGRKLGEEIVRWLEDRVRPELAIAVGVTSEIPLALGGNCRLGLLEIADRSEPEGRPGIALRQRGQVVLEQELREPEPDDDPESAFIVSIEAMLEAVDAYLDRVEAAFVEPELQVPFLAQRPSLAAVEEMAERPEPGAETLELEREAASYLGADSVLALRSADDAFRLLYEALGLGRGDEVLCSALGSSGALRALREAGLRPVYADVDESRLTLDPECVAEAASGRTRALLISHAFGQPAALDELYGLAEERGLEVIEDGASSLGARFEESRLGRAPCVCAFALPIAPVPGGRIHLVTVPSPLVDRLSALAGPARVGDGAAVWGRRMLAGWEERLAQRRHSGTLYSSELCRYDAFRVPPTPPGALPVYGQYVLGLSRFARTSADDLHKLLTEAGIESRRVSVGLSEREIARLPATEAVRSHALLLPVEAGLTRSQCERVLEAIFDYAIG
jgi:dTDP-4-amino-4,6-dideoxygalactose transaminase